MYYPSKLVLKRSLERYDHTIDNANWHLNLVGIRSIGPDGKPNHANLYNDMLVVLWHQDGHPNMVYLPMTTDPGETWRLTPLNAKGTAILKPGHYPGMWRIGRHKGISPALVQRAPCTVWRDNNCDNQLDTTGYLETGLFGINLHSTHSISQYIGRASAGCQVLRRPKDLALVLALAAKHVAARTPQIDYTLITQDDLSWIQ